MSDFEGHDGKGPETGNPLFHPKHNPTAVPAGAKQPTPKGIQSTTKKGPWLRSLD